MRSPTERAVMAAAAVSLQQASLEGEISPINLCFSSTTATDVCVLRARLK